MDWDDVRFFLAVARGGTLAAAGRALGVDQTTVGRRISALEDSLGGRLFQRTANGYALTRAGHRVMLAAESMADAAAEVEARATAADARHVGTVRVATTSSIADHFVIPALAELRVEHPGIDVVLATDWKVVNLLRGEADVAVRLVRPKDPRLVARKLGEFAFHLFAARSYLKRRGAPKSLKDHDVLAYDDELRTSGALRLAGAPSEGARVVFQTNTGAALLQAMRAGLGVAELPSYAGAAYPDELVRVLPEHEVPYAVWMVVHQDVRRAPRVRVVCDAIAGRFPGGARGRERGLARGSGTA